MAKETENQEETAEEKTEETSEEKTEEKTEEELEAEQEKKDIQIQMDFDKEIDSEEEAEEKSDEKTEDEEKEEKEEKEASEKKPADEKAEEEDSGKKEKEEKAEFSDTLLERAAKAGLTLGEARKFSTPEDLERSLNIFEKGKESEEEKFDCGLDPKKYEPEVIESMNKLGQQNLDLQKVIKEQAEAGKKAAEKSTADRDAEELARKTEAFDDYLDGKFANEKDFVEEFGTEGRKKIDKKSPEFANRTKVGKKMTVLLNGYIATDGKNVPSDDEIFTEALNSVFHEKVTQLAVTGTKKKMKKQADQTVGRSSSKGTALTAEQKVEAAHKEFDKKLAEEEES